MTPEHKELVARLRKAMPEYLRGKLSSDDVEGDLNEAAAAIESLSAQGEADAVLFVNQFDLDRIPEGGDHYIKCRRSSATGNFTTPLYTRPAPAPVPDAVEAAMRILTKINVAQYLLANTRKRSNGAAKASHHDELTKLYVAVVKNCDPDRVRQRYAADYKRVHDLTAERLTDHLDREVGFDLDGYVDDAVCERFFVAFHRIAMSALASNMTVGDRPDWNAVYRSIAHTADRDGELVAVTRETLRLAVAAIRSCQERDAYHNFAAAEIEINRALAASGEAGIWAYGANHGSGNTAGTWMIAYLHGTGTPYLRADIAASQLAEARERADDFEELNCQLERRAEAAEAERDRLAADNARKDAALEAVNSWINVNYDRDPVPDSIRSLQSIILSALAGKE